MGHGLHPVTTQGPGIIGQYSSVPVAPPSFKEALAAVGPQASTYDPYRFWPPGTEIYPPYEQGMMFYMVFPPGYPPDLRDRLKALYHDPSTDKLRFADMYPTIFTPDEMKLGDTSGIRPRWTASWRHYLAITLRGGEAFLGGVDPAYRAAAREGHRLAARLLWDDPRALAILPTYLRPTEALQEWSGGMGTQPEALLPLLNVQDTLEGALLARLGGNRPGRIHATLTDMWMSLQFEGVREEEGEELEGDEENPWWARAEESVSAVEVDEDDKDNFFHQRASASITVDFFSPEPSGKNRKTNSDER